ncbi:hypothetical protein BH24GEM1_BH24GEM1_07930 [soil metagenome]
MCYHLRIASPLTLSEVRSMLPAGITADVLPTSDLARLRGMLPGAQTAAHIRVGPCSCDLVRPRHADPREDERHLRQRYAMLELSRTRIIEELERHRTAAAPVEPPGGWRRALAGFVVEHARNAGPTLYHLVFQPGWREAADPRAVTRTVTEVRADPEGWLTEGQPVLVVR